MVKKYEGERRWKQIAVIKFKNVWLDPFVLCLWLIVLILCVHVCIWKTNEK